MYEEVALFAIMNDSPIHPFFRRYENGQSRPGHYFLYRGCLVFPLKQGQIDYHDINALYKVKNLI